MLAHDFWKRMARGPQVVTPKDAGAIVAHTGLRSGDRAADAGSGSGWLAVFLGGIVAPAGKVFTYESREDFARIASRNVEKAGLAGVVEVRNADVFAGIAETDLDLVTLDMADSDKVLALAEKSLKMGGYAVGYFPNVEQAQRFVYAANALKMRHEGTIEVQEREWKIRPYGCRPENVGMQFTGFLTFLRKVGAKEFDVELAAQEGTKGGRRERRIRDKLG